MFKNLLTVLAVFIILITPALGFSEDEKNKDEDKLLAVIVGKTLGETAVILRTEAPADSPVKGWKQRRVWIKSVYGETPVLFYFSEDGKLVFAGTIFDAAGENLTRKDAGDGIPMQLKEADMELNEDYLIGSKDAPAKAVLWINTNPVSLALFTNFYTVYSENKDKMAIYIKFYPLSETEVEKMKALTCYKGEKIAEGLRTLFSAAPSWGSKDDLDSFRKAGGGSCNEDQIKKDLALVAKFGLPLHPISFINGTMLLKRASKENIGKLAGTELK